MSKTDDRYKWVVSFVGDGRSIEAIICYIPPALLTTRATITRWLNHWVSRCLLRKVAPGIYAKPLPKRMEHESSM